MHFLYEDVSEEEGNETIFNTKKQFDYKLNYIELLELKNNLKIEITLQQPYLYEFKRELSSKKYSID
jgi:hypothetical protein